MKVEPAIEFTLERYLQKYGEPEANVVLTPGTCTEHVLVIPAYQEKLSDIEKVFSNLSNVTIILVVNSPNDKDPNTQQLLEDIDANWPSLAANNQTGMSSHTIRRHQTPNLLPALVVDRYQQPIDPKHGVGKARKIGADIACRLFLEGTVRQPWVYLTDADAVLPANYFENTSDPHDEVCKLFRFDHETTDDLPAALYEFSLLWYAYGLQHAGSMYAYPSIGSCIACNMTAYAKVRGFPNRAAGEDFYLLNKIRKLGNFTYSSSDAIKLSNRRSTRVPFGTGPGIAKIEQLNSADEALFYHPSTFELLKAFMEQLNNSYEVDNLDQYFKDELQNQFVRQTGLLTLLQRQQKQNPEVYRKFITDWFDGFRTLKFVHFVREHKHPSVPYRALWQSSILSSQCPGESPDKIKIASEQLWAITHDKARWTNLKTP